MSRLRDRIARQAANQAQAQAAYHPFGTADTPMQMPMVQVRFGPGGAAVEQMVPLYVATGTGAVPIPATQPGRYDQVIVSSRP